MSDEQQTGICVHSGYNGPERRQGERRAEECMLHSGMQKSYDDLKDLQEKACRAIGRVEKSMEGKVPMKLFYVMIGLVVAILAFQWTTYERVNKIALENQKASGDLKLTIEKTNNNVEVQKNINEIELRNLANSVDRHQVVSDRTMGEIRNDIKSVKKDVQDLKRQNAIQHQ